MFIPNIAKDTPKHAPAFTSNSTDTPYVTAEVVAKKFSVHKRTVCLWAVAGTIPCIRVGGSVRFDMEAVLGAIA